MTSDAEGVGLLDPIRYQDLEYRQRVRRRAGPALNVQRRDHEEELVPLPLGARLRQRLQIVIVEEMNAHSHYGHDVDRQPHLLEARWRYIADAIAAQHSDPALVQPG